MSEEFAKAFLAAQKEFPSIHKGRTADMGNYSYSYADLGDVLDAALPILHKHGLWLSQPPVSESGQVGVETLIGHSSGHVQPMGILLLPAGNSPQTAGSAMTYARRYAACAALGIVADEDDDGAAASRPEPQVEQVGLAELIRMKVAVFSKWSEEERRDVWVAHAKKVLDGKPKHADEVDLVVKSMADQYYEEHPPTDDEAPF